ncbi:MAG: FecR domain-containing protein [Acidobacteriota bacterium]|nr:FecR domain-containing protein [Acidobacteriota bacterium]
MTDKHITEKLSAYLNFELPKEERQAIAEHLLQCEKCRNEHDEIKLGVGLANQLPRAGAPENLWSEIERNLNGREKTKVTLIPQFSFFNSRSLAVACLCFGFVIVLIMGVVNFIIQEPQQIVEQSSKTNSPENTKPIVTQTSGESLTNQNSGVQVALETNSTAQNQSSNGESQTQTANSKVKISPKINPLPAKNKTNEVVLAKNNLPGWNVETIAGTPRAGNQTVSEKGKLTVGEFLETDANSRAKIEVADIGQVEIAPNSRVQLVKTHSTEHRLSLNHGLLHAKIFAPPRLFIVDTPSAVAVDLGCEYTLEVDKDGNNRLHVTSGFVALERDGRESIVPAGAICLTRKGKGIGTPFFDDVSSEFRAALIKFDFGGGGSNSLDTIFKEARAYDSLTLWHLLPRTHGKDREKVFDALVSFAKLPEGITREGVLKLDKKMLDKWRAEVENLWFE